MKSERCESRSLLLSEESHHHIKTAFPFGRVGAILESLELNNVRTVREHATRLCAEPRRVSKSGLHEQ